MRDDEIRRSLAEADPWWRAAAAGGDPTAWEGAHRLLRDRARHDLGYRSDILADLAAGEIGDSLVVLTGPRRVGKSVVLLDLVAGLCRRRDVDPRQVIHVPCDGLQARDLRRVLTLGRDMTRVVDRNGARRRVWLLDEVSSIRGWTAVLKAARDGTDFGDDTVVGTGSRWRTDEDVEGNLLAGRAGQGATRRVRHLLPMTFRDFVSATRPELARRSTAHPAELQDATVEQSLEEIRFDIDGYDLAWQDYLTCGGFPRAVAEHTTNGEVSIAYIRDLAAWLRRDLDPDAPPESLPLLLARLSARASSPLNVRATATEIGSNRTAATGRFNRLVSSFAALWCPQRDDDGAIVAGAQAKLYLTDPLLAWLPSRLRAGLPPPDMMALTETALAVALARAIDHLDEGRWVAGDTIGYARTGSGNEVDLAPVSVPSQAGPRRSVAIEAKWVDGSWRSEAKVVENKYNAGVFATKSVLDLDHPSWAVPAPIVALLLG
ncbi:MAG: AAA family ATPase [Acidimicrobiia bacterium]